MEISSDCEPLTGGEIHGFHSSKDLSMERLQEHALIRWFRPNEIHAILSNHDRFTIHPQPVQNPTSGTVVLYDRRIVRNFRKDGLNWKKKKDGKAVQEAHEKLKVGNEDRVHVYYARGEDDPNFFRRCYWLLDKELERIVLVHYRATLPSEYRGATDEIERAQIPVQNKKSNLTSVDSHSISQQYSEVSVGGLLNDDINSQLISGGCGGNNEFTLDDINSLDWGDLLESPQEDNFMPAQRCDVTGGFNSLAPEQQLMGQPYGLDIMNNDAFGAAQLNANPTECSHYEDPNRNQMDSISNAISSQTGFVYQQSSNCTNDDYSALFSSPKMYFNITDVSPNWAYSTDHTKVLLVGYFLDQYKNMCESILYCNVGGKIVNTEIIQQGVYRILAPPNIPGNTELYLTLDGPTPISQILPFNYLPNPNLQNPNPNPTDDFPLQIRLAHLLFSTSNKLTNLSTQKPNKTLKELTKYLAQTSPVMEKYWSLLLKNPRVKTEDVLETVLRNKLQEWIVERIAEGSRVTPLDEKGQGAIHLCAMLNYVWAVRLFALSGLSLDFRDCSGWTALHWAAFYGREKMVATLLSAGANPSLVTDPTSDSPGGATAADLAANQNFEGLAAYLAEQGLISHIKAMSLHGNLDSNPNPNPKKAEYPSFSDLSEQELCLKESLAAYRNAAEAANQIQAAFRERALKIQTKQAKLENTEIDAGFIVAALKIQNAFRSYERRKAMRAAARIQSHYRTWQIRRDFLNMRRHAVKIQAVFRGHQVRRQYKKIIWSVGIVEKAILRWRLKKRGLRGIHGADVAVNMDADVAKITGEDPTGEKTGEEDFFRVSREQAEDRYKRSVVRVQALFRSYKAQQEYRRMKMTQEQATLEFELRDSDSDN